MRVVFQIQKNRLIRGLAVTGVLGATMAVGAQQQRDDQQVPRQPSQTPQQRDDARQNTDLDQMRQRLGQQAQQSQRSGLFNAANVLDYNVVDQQGESIGEVSDIVIDPTKNRVSYVVVSHGGVLGMGGTLTAVPLNQLTVQPDQEHLTLTMSAEAFKQREALDSDQWPKSVGGAATAGAQSRAQGELDKTRRIPNTHDGAQPDRGVDPEAARQTRRGSEAADSSARRSSDREAQGRTGAENPASSSDRAGQDSPANRAAQSPTRPGTEQASAAGQGNTIPNGYLWAHRVSKLIDTDVTAEGNEQKSESIGKLKNLLIDKNNGRVGFAVLSFDAGGEKGTAVIPASVLQLEPDEKHFTLRGDSNRLAAHTVSDDAALESLINDPGRLREIEQAFPEAKQHQGWLKPEAMRQQDASSGRTNGQGRDAKQDSADRPSPFQPSGRDDAQRDSNDRRSTR